MLYIRAAVGITNDVTDHGASKRRKWQEKNVKYAKLYWCINYLSI